MISLLSKGPSRVFSSTTLGKQRVYCFSINVLCDLAYLHRCSCPGEGNGNSLQHSHLENPTYRGAWRATVHRVAESRTRVSDSHTHRHTHTHGCSRKGALAAEGLRWEPHSPAQVGSQTVWGPGDAQHLSASAARLTQGHRNKGILGSNRGSP